MHLLSILPLVVLAICANAADTMQADINLALECFGKRDTHTLMAGADGKCACNPKGAALGTSKECPHPAGEAGLGYGVCMSDSVPAKCDVICSSEAESDGKGGCRKYRTANDLTGKIWRETDTGAKIKPGMILINLADNGCKFDWPFILDKEPGSKNCLTEAKPADSIATCKWNTEKIGKAFCAWECKPGFKTSEDGKTCVAGSSGTTDPDPKPKPDDLVTDCNAGTRTMIMLASPSGRCQCYKRALSGTEACVAPPSGKGTAACQNTGEKSSVCTVQCIDGYKPTPDGKDCVRKGEAKIVPDTECIYPPKMYLSAVVGSGCVCLEKETSDWCGDALQGDMTCEQDESLTQVKCAVTNCPTGFVPAADKKSCVEEVNKTIDNTDCVAPSKNYALAGAGKGCKCLSPGVAVPDGALECKTPPEHALSSSCYFTGKNPKAAAYCTAVCETGYQFDTRAMTCEEM